MGAALKHTGVVLRLEKSYLMGEIASPPPSKSYTHKAIFAAAFAKGTSKLHNTLNSRDTQASVLVAMSMGAEIRRDGDTLVIIGDGKERIQENQLYLANSGTTLRQAIAIASLGNMKIGMMGDSSLNKRPMDPLVGALSEWGAKINTELLKKERDGKNYYIEVAPLTVRGPVTGGKFVIEGSQSSQYASSLLFALPLMKDGGELKIEGEQVSKPYIDVTRTVAGAFKVEIKEIEPYRHYSVVRQHYMPTEFTIPTDYSAVSLLVTAGILLGRNEGITINVQGENLPQGDKAYLGYMEQLGAKINTKNGKIAISPIAKLTNGSFDLSDNPDLLPPLAIASLKCAGELEIKNVEHARAKETDRIDVLTKQLRKIGMRVDETRDGMTLKRTGELNGAELDAHDDHRLFMALSIAGMFVGNSTIRGVESVNVSYPNFVSDLKGVGAKMKVLTR